MSYYVNNGDGNLNWVIICPRSDWSPQKKIRYAQTKIPTIVFKLFSRCFVKYHDNIFFYYYYFACRFVLFL